MQDEYPQYLKLQAPCGSYNLVITVNLSTNTNSKTNKQKHPASSASKFRWELKKKVRFHFGIFVSATEILLLTRRNESNNKEKHPDLPSNYCTTDGSGDTTNNSPYYPDSGETHNALV